MSRTNTLYNALLKAGYDAQLALVEGASHTQTLTTELLHAAIDFVKAACR